MVPLSELRHRISEVTKRSEIGEHKALLAGLARTCPHTVKLVAPKHRMRPVQPLYTCFVFAFDLVDSLEYTRLASRPLAPFAGPAFVRHHLASGRLAEIERERAVYRDIAVYFASNGEPTHAGIVLSSETIMSKWGIGNLYEHALEHVPDTYGDLLRFFRGNTRDLALVSFLEFTHDEGYD